ncbi:MAG: VPLPA-CTERM-specific exosortase XrtD [Nitrospiraceae bacterium]
MSSPPVGGGDERVKVRQSLAITVLLAVGVVSYMYADSLVYLVGQWGSEDYSHGFFVPLVSGFLIWQKRSRLASVGIHPSWWGPPVIFIGLLLFVIGNYATLYIILHLSLWLVIAGLVLSFIGPRAIREIAFPLLYLMTCIPLPVFLYGGLSGQLQLWSSALGIGCLQLVGVTAFREGNVIDLGPIQLHVVEACSGIRYLFPLTSLALLCAYLFRDRTWKRIVVVLSALPISVVVNGFRIGVVGILVEHYGSQAAEGFLHLFEGWVLFMASLGLLVLEMWALSRFQPVSGSESFFDRFTWRDGSDVSERVPPPETFVSQGRLMPTAYLCGVAMLIPFAIVDEAIGKKQEYAPVRSNFVDFPMNLRAWQGTHLPMEPQYLSVLQLDDYLLADYSSVNGERVNVYVAYYGSQEKGRSAHSPQSCIPGGGWEIDSHRSMDLSVEDHDHGVTHPVNRVLIKKDRQQQLVLYWFKQRERLLSNEYLVKLYLFWDALTKGRSDGALIRLASAIEPGESEESAERRLVELARQVQPELSRYLPD